MKIDFQILMRPLTRWGRGRTAGPAASGRVFNERALPRALAFVLAFGLAAVVVPSPGRAAATAPRVEVSILPLHALVAGVMKGVGAPGLIVPPRASPHDYALRPSEARRIARADLVFWLGKSLEPAIAKHISAIAGRGRAVALADAAGIRRLRLRRPGVWPPGDGERASSPARDAQEAALDPHVWLDPANARVMVRVAADQLARVDPGRRARYAANARRIDARLAALDRWLRARLAPVRKIPYAVYHDAYHYLEARYGLSPLGALTAAPERRPGARRIARLRAEIARRRAACVFVPPQVSPALVAPLVAGTGARLAVLDPLGAGLAPGPDAYEALMRNLAETLRDCLLSPQKAAGEKP